MKIVFVGTEHTKEDEEIEVAIEKPLADGDDWTFTIDQGLNCQRSFTISDLTTVMDFLRRMTRRQE